MDDIKLAGKKQNLDPMWNLLNDEVDLGETTSFLDHVYLGMHSTTMPKQAKILWDNYRTMLESRNFRGGNRKTTTPSKNFAFLHGLMIWRVMQRNVWSGIVS